MMMRLVGQILLIPKKATDMDHQVEELPTRDASSIKDEGGNTHPAISACSESLLGVQGSFKEYLYLGVVMP